MTTPTTPPRTPTPPATVEEYLATFPDEVRAVLDAVRQAIRRAAPSATEGIGYQMAAFRVDGRYLVYLGGWKHHVGIYPVMGLDAALEAEVAPFRSGRGTLKFPLDLPVPPGRIDLIERIVAALLAQRTAR